MRARLLTAVAFLSIAVQAHAQQRGAVDWIFLVDTSKSMRGLGGTKDIFDDVKASVGSFVREANDGDSVAIFTFDRDVRLHSAMEIEGTAREDLHAITAGLEANGDRTHLGGAIAAGLTRAESLRRKSDATRVRAVVLFTDGKEDVHGIADPVPISSNLEKVADTFVFFVSMGEHEPKLDQFARDTERTSVLKAPTPAAIARVAQEIRAKLPTPPKPQPLLITLTPTAIDFGEVRRGKPTPERELRIAANRPARVAVTLANAEGVTMKAIEVNAPATIRLHLEVGEDAPPGPQRLTIYASNAAVRATVTVLPPSMVVRALQGLAALALLVAAAFLAWKRHRSNHELEGELEILAPRVGSDAAFVGLPQLQATKVVLSSIVPAEALAGSDARLFVRRRDGAKRVWIAVQSGSLRINDVETPTGELYDADTIHIGEAKLRFNRLGHERAETSIGEDL